MAIQHTIPRWRTDLINQPRRATHAWTTEATNRRINRVQLQDFQGLSLTTRQGVQWWLTTQANGTPSTRILSASGAVRAVTLGEVLSNITVATGRNAGVAYSNTAGRIDIGVHTSGNQAWRIALIFPDGSRSVSSQASWVL